MNRELSLHSIGGAASDGESTKANMGPFIREVTLPRERVTSFDVYAFNMPAVRSLDRLPLHPKVTYFAGNRA